MVLPSTKLVTYEVSIKRIMAGKLVLGIADGVMKADGKQIYTTESMKVGLFTD
jgi:3-hydroxyacyl-[acyl-carrier protein] dehydratase/trans-2-decenoyl-[acyl-carrier protein] isomerase